MSLSLRLRLSVSLYVSVSSLSLSVSLSVSLWACLSLFLYCLVSLSFSTPLQSIGKCVIYETGAIVDRVRVTSGGESLPITRKIAAILGEPAAKWILSDCTPTMIAAPSPLCRISARYYVLSVPGVMDYPCQALCIVSAQCDTVPLPRHYWIITIG